MGITSQLVKPVFDFLRKPADGAGAGLLRIPDGAVGRVLGMPVKIGIPTGFSAGLVREIENPIYATCVGLVLHGLRHKQSSELSFADTKTNGKSGGVIKVFNKMKSWFDEL